ncbi:MAG: lyase family protein, partial [Sedimentisphaerales bacterium]|nr:lyase family protein [Sedimentisphaerales bacterium]
MNDAHRQERDFLGNMMLPKEALYGIHTQRAMENFPLSHRPIHPSLIRAYGAVKLAAAQANDDLGVWDEVTFEVISQACTDMMEGRLDDYVRVDALQGGAGTSTNMNVNEVIANRALQLLGKNPGEYEIVHPINDINLHQSTNDTFPTALKIAAIKGLRNLEQALIVLLEAFQHNEKEFRNVVKVGRTQMQDAVLTTMGRTMSAYAEAFTRDRWRVYKCEERLRVINLGGTAIGTGLGAPRQYIFKVTEKLKAITGYGLARA